MDAHEAAVILPDAYLQLTIPRFELSHRNLPASVRFVGAFPIIPRQAPLPSWALVLDGSRKTVPLTQGTISNHDFGQLIAPTLVSLANLSEVLVVVTARGRSVVAILGPIPDNAWIASHLPFEWLLPKVAAFVTDGGYGSMNQVFSFGVPLVTAGMSEDKAGANARVAWSGVSIVLRTQGPTMRSSYGSLGHAGRAELSFAGITSAYLAATRDLPISS